MSKKKYYHYEKMRKIGLKSKQEKVDSLVTDFFIFTKEHEFSVNIFPLNNKEITFFFKYIEKEFEEYKIYSIDNEILISLLHFLSSFKYFLSTTLLKILLKQETDKKFEIVQKLVEKFDLTEEKVKRIVLSNKQFEWYEKENNKYNYFDAFSLNSNLKTFKELYQQLKFMENYEFENYISDFKNIKDLRNQFAHYNKPLFGLLKNEEKNKINLKNYKQLLEEIDFEEKIFKNDIQIFVDIVNDILSNINENFIIEIIRKIYDSFCLEILINKLKTKEE